jgi:PAS domain S-box-containing protein
MKHLPMAVVDLQSGDQRRSPRDPAARPDLRRLSPQCPVRVVNRPSVNPRTAAAQLEVPILLVDDTPARRTTLRQILSPLGYRIVEVDSGVAALRCLTAVQDFAVILLAVSMPVMSGIETATFIRQRRRSETTPIIFLATCQSEVTVCIDAIKLGEVNFVVTPCDRYELGAKVGAFASRAINADGPSLHSKGARLSSDQLRLLAESAPTGMFMTDSENRFIYTNPRWSEITGMSSEQVMGRSHASIVEAQYRAGRIPKLPDASMDDPDACYRTEIQLPGLSPRTLLVTSRAISNASGRPSGWVGTVADVTAEALAEVAISVARDEANEASQLKSDFIANISHELRTPMNGVIGMTDLLLESDLDARQHEFAETVRVSGEALLSIIDEILDFSRLETGRQKIENVEFSVRTIVEDTVLLLAGAAQAKGLELMMAFGSSVPAIIFGDPGRLRQVLTKLIGNAIKFTQIGEIVVRVTVTAADDNSAVIRFEVSDTGDGIASEKLDVIFQPFVQADTSTSRRYDGIGLGLSVCQELVALMGGNLEVSSELGVGSAFSFMIRARSDNEVVTEDLRNHDDLAEAAGPINAGRILLVEDNLINQKVAIAILSSAGYSVDTVLDGAEAVKVFGNRPYDAVLMDCRMPVMNGYEATTCIRAKERPSRHTPIIALTAGAQPEDRQRCLSAGMDSYLAKPVNKEALLAKVARFVKA